MVTKSLTDHVADAAENVEMAEIHYSRFPSVLSAIKLIAAIDHEDKIKEICESIMLNIEEDEDNVPKKKKKRRTKKQLLDET